MGTAETSPSECRVGRERGEIERRERKRGREGQRERERGGGGTYMCTVHGPVNGDSKNISVRVQG